MTTPFNGLSITSLWIAGLLLCAVSILYTVQLWISIPHDQSGKILAGCAAVALEICKFLFIPLGLYLLKNKFYTSGSVLLLMGCVLLIVSIGASIGFLERSTDKAEQTLLSQSDEYKTIKSKLHSLSEQINTLNESARIDLKNNYRTRARATLTQIADLEVQREIWLEDIKKVKPAVKTSAEALFGSMSRTFGSDEKTIQNWAYIILAVLIDLCSLTVFSVLSLKAPATQQQPVIQSNINDIQLVKFKNTIKQLQSGQKIHLRLISDECGFRYKQLKRDTSDLENTGLVVRKGEHLVAI